MPFEILCHHLKDTQLEEYIKRSVCLIILVLSFFIFSFLADSRKNSVDVTILSYLIVT